VHTCCQRHTFRRGFRGEKYVATFKFYWNNSAIVGFVPRWIGPGDLLMITLQPSDQKARFYGKIGTVTYFRPLKLASFSAFGRPTGSGRSRRPSVRSSLRRNPSLASGWPVCVQRRRFSASPSSSGSASCRLHRAGGQALRHSARSSSPLASLLAPTCAAALDHS